MTEDHESREDLVKELQRLRERVAELEAAQAQHEQTEAELRELKRFHEDIAQSVAEGIVLEEEQGCLTFVNPAAAALLGYTPEELLGKPWTLIVPPDQRAHVLQADRRRAQGLTDRYELEVCRKDGTRVPVLVSGGPRFEGDRFVGTLAVLTDISERKQAEEKIRLRTLQLEAANRELEAFSYSVSHDLRAPLRAMDGFSRILLEDHAAQLSSEARHYLQRIRENAEQMGELIDDLLAFSRLSRQALRRQQVSLSEVARQAINDLRHELEGRTVELSVGELPACEADPSLLKQVFVNLISNALKFSRERPVARIHVGCERREGECVCFVKDNGVGFDMRYADKLFGVFQRLHRVEEYDGTGVGLAVVQRIVHRHGGRVWAEGEVDSGATFSFTLGGTAHDE
jgi:PAS domain S-box-containing protein